MATLATFVNRFVGVRELADVSPAVWTRTESPRLRPIANEDVYLFVKRIDNTAVVRAADPAASLARSRSMLTGFVAAMLVIAGLVPTAYNTTAGFTLQQLRGEQVQLQQQMTKLHKSDPATDQHAGERETSELMFLRPDLVKLDRAKDESGKNQQRLALPDLYTAIWWYAAYPNHYAGDASVSTKELGQVLTDARVASIVKALKTIKADTKTPALQQEFFDRVLK